MDVETARASGLVRYGELMFRYRNYVFPLLMLGLFAAFRPAYIDAPGTASLWLDALGIGVCVLGQLIRAAVVGLAYIKRGGVDKKVYAESLVTRGIFAHCRNPLYVGNALILLGLFVIHGNPWAIALGGAFFTLSYIAIVAAEERYLATKFGSEFDAYCARVPRWRLRLGGLRATMASMRFNWRRLVIKEYASAATWVLTASALVAYKDWLRPAAAGPGLASAAALVAVSAGVFAVSVRVLKKSGRLRERPG